MDARYSFGLLIGMVLASAHVASASDGTDATLRAGAWSNYVSEGRDQLQDGGVLAGAYSLDRSTWSGGILILQGLEQDFRELGLSLSHGSEFESLRYQLAITHSELSYGGSDDTELAVALDTSLPDAPLELTARYAHSLRADGGFLSLGAAADIPLSRGRFDLRPAITYSADFGYATPEHDGSNDIQYRLELVWRAGRTVEAVFFLAHTQALADLRRHDRDDISWFGLDLYVTL